MAAAHNIPFTSYRGYGSTGDSIIEAIEKAVAVIDNAPGGDEVGKLIAQFAGLVKVKA
jgi:hypothetical protein